MSFKIYSQQINKEGIPLITNYAPKQYNAHNENWMSVVNKYGILYFANTSGNILEYDGKNWNLIPSKRKTIIYSLACDSNGIIYVGAQGDFGCIKPNTNGKLIYYSLAEQYNDSTILKQTFWKTYVGNNQEVYFCSPSNIYIYNLNKNKIKKVRLPKNSWLSFYINSFIYVSNLDSGLLKYVDGKFYSVEGFQLLKNYDIQIIEELNFNKWLIFNGLKFFIYDLVNKKLLELEDNLSIWKYLINNYAYHSCNVDNNTRIWSTINGGLVVSTSKLRKNYIINDSLGLNSSQVSSVNYCKIDGTIWATTLNGISKIEYHNPLRYFGYYQSLKGNVYCIRRYKGKLYASTSSGLFVLENNTYNSSFKKIDYFKDNIVNFIEVVNFNGDEKLLISSQSMLFEFDGNKIKNISDDKEFIVECLLQTNDKKYIYLGTQNGLYKCSYNGKYKIEKQSNINDFIMSIIEDDEGNVWFSTLSNGVYSISKEGNIKHYSNNDLPVLNDIYLNYYNGNVLLCTSKGLFFYNKVKNKVEKYNELGEWLIKENLNIISCFKGYNNQFWFNINNRLYLISNKLNKYYVDSITFRRIPVSTIYNVYSEPTGITWIATNEGLYSYDSKKEIPKSKFYALIRSIRLIYNDSVFFYGAYYNPSNKISYVQDLNYNNYVLEYKYNALTFTFAAPYYQEESKIEFSYILEGFDDHWSNWTNENNAKYTNLPEGKYTFKVKARNIYYQESEIATFTFEIRPPWYRTTLAYVLYVIFTIIIFIVSIKLYTRKLEADKRRLEKIVEERTEEIVKQKNEIEIKNKLIEQKNKDITDSIYYAKRIQEAILPPKEYIQGTNVDMFIYFRPKDIVSGDFYFIKNLTHAKILIVAAADCTGHGVPGAFMSMLGSSLLNEIVIKPEVNRTDIVLNELRKAVINSLNPEGKEFETKDGMDISLIAYNYETHMLEFSCANNPIYLIRNNELIEYKPDKMPVGLYERRQEPFTRNEIKILDKDIVYLFSDGFADQFGGEHGKKYLYKRFKEFLLSIHHLPMEEQEKLIEQENIQWRGEIEQIDDQIVIGVKFNVNL